MYHVYRLEELGHKILHPFQLLLLRSQQHRFSQFDGSHSKAFFLLRVRVKLFSMSADHGCFTAKFLLLVVCLTEELLHDSVDRKGELNISTIDPGAVRWTVLFVDIFELQ